MSSAALKKALYSLFGDSVPSEGEIENVANKIFREIVEATPDGDDNGITKTDMYHYLVKKSPMGLSSKSVDQLFVKLDASGDGSINQEEFTKVIGKLCKMLRKDHALEMKLASSVPGNHVVPGSSRMNLRSGTKAFRLQVVRRRSMRTLFDVFNEVNLDGDGAINLMEFKRHIAAKRPDLFPMATSIFNSMDNRHTGTVSFKRLLERMFPEATSEDVKTLLHMARPKGYVPKAKPDQGMLDEIQSIFQIYDDDRSGTLDEEEFVYAMSQTGGYTEEYANQMFREIDSDGSGEVTFDEFRLWYIGNNMKQEKIMRDADKDSDEEV